MNEKIMREYDKAMELRKGGDVVAAFKIYRKIYRKALKERRKPNRSSEVLDFLKRVAKEYFELLLGIVERHEESVSTKKKLLQSNLGKISRMDEIVYSSDTKDLTGKNVEVVNIYFTAVYCKDPDLHLLFGKLYFHLLKLEAQLSTKAVDKLIALCYQSSFYYVAASNLRGGQEVSLFLLRVLLAHYSPSKKYRDDTMKLLGMHSVVSGFLFNMKFANADPKKYGSSILHTFEEYDQSPVEEFMTHVQYFSERIISQSADALGRTGFFVNKTRQNNELVIALFELTKLTRVFSLFSSLIYAEHLPLFERLASICLSVCRTVLDIDIFLRKRNPRLNWEGVEGLYRTEFGDLKYASVVIGCAKKLMEGATFHPSSEVVGGSLVFCDDLITEKLQSFEDSKFGFFKKLDFLTFCINYYLSTACFLSSKSLDRSIEYAEKAYSLYVRATEGGYGFERDEVQKAVVWGHSPDKVVYRISLMAIYLVRGVLYGLDNDRLSAEKVLDSSPLIWKNNHLFSLFRQIIKGYYHRYQNWIDEGTEELFRKWTDDGGTEPDLLVVYAAEYIPKEIPGLVYLLKGMITV